MKGWNHNNNNILYVYCSCQLYTTVPPMTAPTIAATTPLSSTSFTISWTINNPSYNCKVTWTNLHTGVMDSANVIIVTTNANSLMVTGLSGIDNYNVSVVTFNPCGMMMSDSITVYGKMVYAYSRL